MTRISLSHRTACMAGALALALAACGSGSDKRAPEIETEATLAAVAPLADDEAGESVSRLAPEPQGNAAWRTIEQTDATARRPNTEGTQTAPQRLAGGTTVAATQDRTESTVPSPASSEASSEQAGATGGETGGSGGGGSGGASGRSGGGGAGGGTVHSRGGASASGTGDSAPTEVTRTLTNSARSSSVRPQSDQAPPTDTSPQDDTAEATGEPASSEDSVATNDASPSRPPIEPHGFPAMADTGMDSDPATGASAGSPADRETEPGRLDWCARIAVRPMRRMQPGRGCKPYLAPRDVADRADLVLLGSELDVAADENPERTSCGGPFSHENNRDFIEKVRGLRHSSQPVRFIHMSRFELVAASQAALPGFDPQSLLQRAGGTRDPAQFFAADRSQQCQGKRCRWDFARWETRSSAVSLKDSIDRQHSGASKSVVYYLPRVGDQDTVFGPYAGIADLRNRDYRAWRVDLAKRAIELGQYDAVDLNHKFDQYSIPGFWLESDRYPTVTDYVESKDSVWSAAPQGYGYPEYVAGWNALAADLRRAGVPFAVRLQPNPWLRTADDPASSQDERALILAGVQSASMVILDVGNAYGRTPDEWEALVGAKGARVFRVDGRCGFAHGEAW